MEKLEIKYLAPYLPYGLKVLYQEDPNCELIGMSLDDITVTTCDGGEYTHISQIKQILRPLSDLTKEIEHNGEKFVPYDILLDMELKDITLRSDGCLTINHRNMHNCENWRISKLFEWHFDVFRLIEKGLAIDINTLEK